MLDILLPEGGAVAAFVEAYIDESGTHAGSRVMSVAGYLYLKAGATRFSREWGKVLKRENLPYFHMVDCAHRMPPFDQKSRDECIAIEKALIARIHADSVFGFAVSVSEEEYDTIIGKHPAFGSAYSFCLRGCLSFLSKWRQDTKFQGEVAYFFESGHKDQGEANRIMSEIFAHEPARKRFAYGSHTFVDKSKVVPLQSADLLAWLWRNNRIRILDGIPQSRKDLIHLVRPADKALTYDAALLHQMADLIRQQGAEAAARVEFYG